MTVSVRLQKIPIKAWSWLAILLSPFHISCAFGGILPINGVSLGLASRNGLIAHQANINCLLDCSISDPLKKHFVPESFNIPPQMWVYSYYLLMMLMCRLCTLFYVELKRWGQRGAFVGHSLARGSARLLKQMWEGIPMVWILCRLHLIMYIYIHHIRCRWSCTFQPVSQKNKSSYEAREESTLYRILAYPQNLLLSVHLNQLSRNSKLWNSEET